jgi:hypothetical protein
MGWETIAKMKLLFSVVEVWIASYDCSRLLGASGCPGVHFFGGKRTSRCAHPGRIRPMTSERIVTQLRFAEDA